MNQRIPNGNKVVVPYSTRYRSKWRQGVDMGTRPASYEATIEDSFEANGEYFYTLRFSDNIIMMGIQRNKFDVVEAQQSSKKVLRKKKV